MTVKSYVRAPSKASRSKVTVDLDELQEAVNALHEELDEDFELAWTSEDLARILAEDDDEIDENITTGSDDIFASQEDAGDDEDESGGGALAGSAAAEEADTKAKSEEGSQRRVRNLR